MVLELQIELVKHNIIILLWYYMLCVSHYLKLSYFIISQCDKYNIYETLIMSIYLKYFVGLKVYLHNKL